jgi:hypothetical protein
MPRYIFVFDELENVFESRETPAEFCHIFVLHSQAV